MVALEAPIAHRGVLCGVLLLGGTLLGGGASDLQRKRCELPSGVRRPTVAHRGAIIGPRLRLDNRGRRCVHQPAAQGGPAPGGQRF